MNKKILSKLILDSKNDLTKISQPYIMETFGYFWYIVYVHGEFEGTEPFIK